MTTMSAREFSQNVSAAKRAAAREPVIITYRGKPAYVLLSIDEFRRLVSQDLEIVPWLSMGDDADFETGPLDLKLTVSQL